MNYLRKILTILGAALILLMSPEIKSQSLDHMNQYNQALEYYRNGEYINARIILQKFTSAMEGNPASWLNAGNDYKRFIFRVYRLTGECFYMEGNSRSLDILLDNLIYVWNGYMDPNRVIETYNSTKSAFYQ